MNLENNKPISVIVSPFFPFNRIFSNEVVYSLFGSIQYNPIFLDYSKDTTYDEFVLNISQIIINEKEPVYIVSFGVFSYIAGELVKRFSEKIKGVFFIEPDFYGTLLSGKYKKNSFWLQIHCLPIQIHVSIKKSLLTTPDQRAYPLLRQPQLHAHLPQPQKDYQGFFFF